MVSKLVDIAIGNSIFQNFVSVCRGISSVRLSFPGIYFKVGMAALVSPFIHMAVALLRRYIGAFAVEEGTERRNTLKF